MPTKEEFLKQGNEFYEQKQYDKAIDAYTKAIEVDQKYQDAYFNRGIVYRNLKQYERALRNYARAIEIDPKHALSYNGRGIVYAELRQYDKAIEEYTKAIEMDSKYQDAFHNRGVTYAELNDHSKAIQDYTKAIEINPRHALSYNARGSSYRALKNDVKAIEEYSKAIEIDPKHPDAFYNRGTAYNDVNEYIKAVHDYTKAIEIDPGDALAYNGRGIAYKNLKQEGKAIEDYSKAIEIDPKFDSPYYNRADVYSTIGNYKDAIADYECYIELTKGAPDFFTEVAKSEIVELRKKLEDEDYGTINQLVSSIKTILLFEKKYLTHYTSLSAAQFMILDGSAFRLSEGAYLNDTSEGRELFNYLSFHTQTKNRNETIPEPFVERPFIGSFVADAKHDDLTLWRMYGKEAQVEARGCALTIEKEGFLVNIKDELNTSDKKSESQPLAEEQFRFYQVAYRTNNGKEAFTIPDAKPPLIKKLNENLKRLQEKLKAVDSQNQTKIQNIRERLNDIAYLFKSSEYQYEHEVRLVVSGVGFEKMINKNAVPPRVYIELVNIAPVVSKITLGPKVERPDEWAAAFNYSLKKSDHSAEIVISHLPFK